MAEGLLIAALAGRRELDQLVGEDRRDDRGRAGVAAPR
jgi:hypothetical protein